MQFVNPYFLFGLLAVSIPILIHLFNFHRFRKVYFTNVKFIRQLKQETRKRSRLKHIIVLILRILAVIFLVLAFAQPYIPATNSMTDLNRKNQVNVYIDNSFSMEAVAGSIPLIDIARNKSREIAAVYRPSDEFHLLTNDLEGKHNRLVSQDDFITFLDQVSTSPVHRNLSDITVTLSDDIFSRTDRNRLLYIITDLQKNSLDWEMVRIDSGWMVYLLPLRADDRRNLYIDTCWFESPVQQVFQNVKLMVRLSNQSGEDAFKIPIRLTINGMQKGIANVDIGAGQTVETALPFINYESGAHSGILEITDYPVTYDDRLYLSYPVTGQIPVMVVSSGEGSPYLTAVFGKDTTFVLSNVTDRNIDYSSFSNYQLIILDGLDEVSTGLAQELKRFMDNGGSVLIFPGNVMDRESYDQLSGYWDSGRYTALDTNDSRVSAINLDHPIYQDVFEFIPENIDLPVVRQYFPIARQIMSDQEDLMTLQNGAAFLSLQAVGKGKLYLCAVPLAGDYSNFQRHAVFVPTLYKIALLSGQSLPLYSLIGHEDAIEIKGVSPDGEQTLRIRHPENGFEIIPEHKVTDSMTYVYSHGQVLQAGNYWLSVNDTVLMGISYNYDRKESLMDFYDGEELKEYFKGAGLDGIQIITDSTRPFSLVIEELNKGISLWKWCIVFALVCLACEVLILRFWR